MSEVSLSMSDGTKPDAMTAPRKNRSGTNKRRLDALVGVRFQTSDKEALSEHARRLGFKNAQDLIYARLQDDLVAARKQAS